MDKIKEKLEKLRIDADGATARAEKAEADVRSYKEDLAKRDTEVQSLNNKISLLQTDLERQEKRVEEVKLRKAAGDQHESEVETLRKKIQFLEGQLEDKDVGRKDAVEKARQLELHSEQFERKSKQLEQEKSELERKYEELTSKYNAVQAELATTLQGLEDL